MQIKGKTPMLYVVTSYQYVITVYLQLQQVIVIFDGSCHDTHEKGNADVLQKRCLKQNSMFLKLLNII